MSEILASMKYHMKEAEKKVHVIIRKLENWDDNKFELVEKSLSRRLTENSPYISKPQLNTIQLNGIMLGLLGLIRQ